MQNIYKICTTLQRRKIRHTMCRLLAGAAEFPAFFRRSKNCCTCRNSAATLHDNCCDSGKSAVILSATAVMADSQGLLFETIDR